MEELHLLNVASGLNGFGRAHALARRLHRKGLAR
jgi:hypothetical protein